MTDCAHGSAPRANIKRAIASYNFIAARSLRARRIVNQQN